MSHASTVKPLLKRGALVAAANWEVILLQFIAEACFKLLLVVPVIAAAFLVVLLAGGSAVDLASRDARQVLSLVLGALGEHPGALASYAAGAAIIVAGGAALTFLAKGGTVSVLVRAERHAPPVEEPPLRLRTFRRAEAFAVHRFGDGARRLFRRYLALGVLLSLVYAALAGAYLAVVLATYQVVRDSGLVVGWTLIAAGLSGALVLAITIVNLLYLLVQLAVAFDNCGLRKAMARVSGFLRAEYREVATVFAVMLVIVGLATAASVLATASLGFIGFVPVVGLAVLPMQVVAWLLRGVVFQYIGLTALCAYVRLYRGSRAGRAPLGVPARPATERASWTTSGTSRAPRT
jgi:hypothetical protein